MNIAKASKRDINMALDLCDILESVEKGFKPVAATENGDDEDAEFDRE